MKIAIATDGEMVAPHFGRCDAYTLVEVSDGRVKERNTIENAGHEPGFLPVYLANLGVSCIVAGGMGPKAQSLFAERGIQTLTGVTGRVDDVLDDYLTGALKPGDSLCEHPHGQHNCGH
ncbi:MAG: NifB/NifX family molybdenum-iron cluster-binding protein [Bacillota bacterium]